MTIKVTNTAIQKAKDSDRFEPRYHHVFNKFDEYEKSSNYQILRFGDKKILQKITDGEHAGQTFVEQGVRFVKNSAVRDFAINLFDGFYITLTPPNHGEHIITNCNIKHAFIDLTRK